MSDEYFALIRRNHELTDELAVVRRRMAALDPTNDDNTTYRIALRPDVDGENPMSHDTLMDDIVINNVAMFRAEAMDDGEWWVCCYLDNDTHDRICWSVSAKCRPRRIEWTTTEYPQVATYEHQMPVHPARYAEEPA